MLMRFAYPSGPLEHHDSACGVYSVRGPAEREAGWLRNRAFPILCVRPGPGLLPARSGAFVDSDLGGMVP